MNTSPPRTPKRKRTPNIQSPTDTINPYSLTPSLLHQFHLAGLSDVDTNPSESTPNFPHRGIRQTTRGDEDEGGDEVDKVDEVNEVDDREKQTTYTLAERKFQVLLQSISHLLDRGDIPRAAQAFATALQLRPHIHHAVDIRHHSLWAIGAEILMREGEKPISELSPEQATLQRRRWGDARNVPRVRAYHETLIQKYPADEKRGRWVDARDFWGALLGIEVYDVFMVQTGALRGLEEGGEMEGEEDDEEDEHDMDEEDLKWKRSERKIAAKEKLRQRALARMEDIAMRMDGIIHNLPFKKDVALLKLRATIGLYLGDLLMPLTETSSLAMQRAQDRRRGELQEARAALESVLQLGGELDPASVAFLDLEEEQEGQRVAPIYSSLVIR